MNELKEKYYIALGNLQNMAIDNTKGSKGVNICVLDINEYTAYLQSKIDKAIEILGQYKHLSSPTEEQAEEQEEIVSTAYDILRENK